MINVFKDKSSGTYRYDFRIENRRHRGALKEARNLEQAKLAAMDIWDKIFNHKYNPEEPKPIETPFTTFYKNKFLPHSKLHKKSYADDVRIGEVLCEFFGSELIEGITWERIEEFKSERSRKRKKNEGLRSPSTINRELSVLSKALTIAVKAKVIQRNPCREVDRFKTDSGRSRILTNEEEARLYEALGEDQLTKNVVTMALHTGMRQGEIFKLKWFDVDFARGTIRLRRTKSGKDRWVPMNAPLRVLLESLNRSNEYVFPSPKTKVALVDVKRQFDKAKHAAGLEDFRFHDLRHTAATRMADEGHSMVTIAAILGHSDIRMTSRYAHATDRATRAAVESLAGKSWSSFGQDLPTENSAVDVSR